MKETRELNRRAMIWTASANVEYPTGKALGLSTARTGLVAATSSVVAADTRTQTVADGFFFNAAAPLNVRGGVFLHEIVVLKAAAAQCIYSINCTVQDTLTTFDEDACIALDDFNGKAVGARVQLGFPFFGGFSLEQTTGTDTAAVLLLIWEPLD